MTPATTAALVLFTGITSTSPAMADDPAAIDASETPSAQVQEASRAQAKLANEAAVEEASRGVKASAMLDLDIRLFDRTFVLIAGET